MWVFHGVRILLRCDQKNLKRPSSLKICRYRLFRVKGLSDLLLTIIKISFSSNLCQKLSFTQGKVTTRLDQVTTTSTIKTSPPKSNKRKKEPLDYPRQQEIYTNTSRSRTTQTQALVSTTLIRKTSCLLSRTMVQASFSPELTESARNQLAAIREPRQLLVHLQRP